MSEDAKTFVGQGRAIRTLCRRIAALHPTRPSLAEIEIIKNMAAMLVGSVPQKRGNPNMADVIKSGRAVSAQNAALKREQVKTALAALRQQGLYTYPELAEGLNKREILPSRAAKWTPNLVRHIDTSES